MLIIELSMKFYNQLVFRSPLNAINSIENDTVFSEAIYISTPTFYEENQRLVNAKVQSDKENKKLQISLYKYQTRAKTRCTPFGLFAGLGVGKWENENNIVLNSNLQETLQRKTRLDMNVLYSLAQELCKLPFIKSYLKFYPNTSIYQIGNNYRYIEYYYQNNKRFHKINKVDFSDYLQYILTETKAGLTQKEIATRLVDEDINEEEANTFVDELISSQLLVNQLEPSVTGEDYFTLLLFQLHNINSSHPSTELQNLISLLLNIDNQIKNIDSNISNEIETYKNIYNELKQILPDLSETNLFQTDLYKKAIHNTLNFEIQKQLIQAIDFLNKINPPNVNQRLDDFKKRFYERYEDNEISLSLALDTETGIGYPAKDERGINDLVDDLFLFNVNNETTIKWNVLQAHLLKLITDSNQQHKKIIKINEDNFKEIDFSKSSLPLSFSIMFNVINAQTNTISLKNIGGSSAVNLLGRFAGGMKEVENIVLEITDFEQQQYSDKIFAEIVHLPESRTGNILARPKIRAYEIPYLAKSNVEDKYQIKINDLVLKTANNKLILFDKRLNKEIIPRLGNAHNFSYNSLPVYHFLCDLQSQYFDKNYLLFNWGVLENQFPFLPRVEYQNVILSPAKWRLTKIDLEPLQNKKKSDKEKYQYFAELKHKIELPDKFLIAEGDNELLIDISVPIAIDTFIDTIKNKNEVILEEYLFDDKNALVKDTDGNSYTNECIAIVLNEKEIEQKQSTTTNFIKPKLSKSIFPIGSEWLYYKIYCGVKTADNILTDKINQITNTLLKEKIIDKWFFIRYADPDTHLRVRFHISDLERYNEVLQLVHIELEPLLNEHIISKLQTDTYKRELERYGDNTIELAEDLFFHDSVFVTQMLNLLDTESGGTIRWQMAARSVDEFLNDFKFSLEEKYKWLEQFSLSFFNEHGGGKDLKITLDNKFRTLRSQIKNVLDETLDATQEHYPILELLKERSKKMKPIIQTILEMNNDGTLQANLYDLIGSYIHMNLDRLFMGRNRTNEFVVYDLLAKHYKSILAQQKQLSKKENV